MGRAAILAIALAGCSSVHVAHDDAGTDASDPRADEITISAIDGNNLWGTVRDEDGVQAIVRYRLKVRLGIPGTRP